MSDFPTIGKYSVILLSQGDRGRSMSLCNAVTLCFVYLESIDVGSTVTVTMGVDFKDTIQPASFEIW